MLEKQEKTLVYIAIAIIVFIFFIVLYNIWFPSNKGIKNKITEYDAEKKYSDIRIEYYKKNLTTLLKNTNFENLYKKIDSSYLENYKLDNVGQAKEYFEKNFYIGNEINVNSISIVSQTDDEYIYRAEYQCNSFTRYVTIKETSINDFTFDFDQLDIATNNKNTVVEKDGVKYQIKLLSSTNDSLKLNIGITNLSDNTYKFNFNDIFSIQLKLKDGTYINMATVVAGNKNDYKMNKNYSFYIDTLFNIPMSRQNDIDKIVFNNVYIDDQKQNIEIDF